MKSQVDPSTAAILHGTCSELVAEAARQHAPRPAVNADDYVTALMVISGRTGQMPQVKHLKAIWNKLLQLAPDEALKGSIAIRAYEKAQGE